MAFKIAVLVSGSFASKAVRAWLTAVRAAPRMLRLRKRRFSFCRFRLICDLMLAKVFLQTIIPVSFGKFLVHRTASPVADPASAGPFCYDGDVFYMRLDDLSSKFQARDSTTPVVDFLKCQRQANRVLRKDVESYFLRFRRDHHVSATEA